MCSQEKKIRALGALGSCTSARINPACRSISPPVNSRFFCLAHPLTSRLCTYSPRASTIPEKTATKGWMLAEEIEFESRAHLPATSLRDRRPAAHRRSNDLLPQQYRPWHQFAVVGRPSLSKARDAVSAMTTDRLVHRRTSTLKRHPLSP